VADEAGDKVWTLNVAAGHPGTQTPAVLASSIVAPRALALSPASATTLFVAGKSSSSDTGGKIFKARAVCSMRYTRCVLIRSVLLPGALGHGRGSIHPRRRRREQRLRRWRGQQRAL
jgi:hypothetical protein